MTQACCQPVLHSSTERLGEHFANTRIAVHWLWGSAHLYKQQTFTGAMTQACCQPVLRSSTERLGVHFLPIPELQCIGGGPVHTCMKSKHSQVYLQRHSLLSACVTEQTCIGGGSLHTCIKSKSSPVYLQ